MNQITPKELKEALDKKEDKIAIIDVRTPEEFRDGSIVGAENYPLDDLMEKLEELGNYQKIYVFCRSGGRSKAACSLLEANKLNVYNLVGGLTAWKEEGLPST